MFPRLLSRTRGEQVSVNNRNMSRKKKDIILENIRIESVAAEGKAIARVDGTVLFVQFAVPGDIVDVKVTRKKKNYMLVLNVINT